MVNKVNMALWADGLDSGRFKQGQGALARIVGGEKFYCCLGVACEIAMEHGVALEVGVGQGGYVTFDGTSSYLPVRVGEWLGVMREGDVMLSDTVTAVSANDGYDWPFTQIAAAIRARYVEGNGDEPATSD